MADCITILLRSDRRSAFVAFCVQAGQGQRDDGHKDNFHHGDLHYSLRFDQFGDYLTRHDAATITPMHVAGHDAVVRTGGGLSSFQWDPWAVLNIGFENRWEAVFEGKGIIPVSAGGAFEITDPGISLKHVLVPGSLQDQTGPSIATEFGVLLPEVNGEQGIGATLAGIVSQRWDWGTIHFNVAASLTREHAGDLFTGLILEGPSKWVVRPVAEFFYEEEFGQAHTLSALIGAIWQVNDKLSFDVGFRHATANGSNVNEIRVGLTVGFMTSFGRPNHK